MIDKSRALALLGSNLGPTDVAQALGCDPSYISQLLMDDAFRQQVLALRMEALQAQTIRDRKIDGIEDALIEKLTENVPYLVKTRDILAAFAILNNAKRRGAANGAPIHMHNAVVALVLPQVARRTFIPQVNAQGEVVQVGDEVTTTMPLATLLQQRLQKQIKEVAEDAEVVLNVPQETGVPNGASEEGSGSNYPAQGRKEAAAA